MSGHAFVFLAEEKGWAVLIIASHVVQCQEDQTTAARIASSMSNALKGKPVQVLNQFFSSGLCYHH